MWFRHSQTYKAIVDLSLMEVSIADDAVGRVTVAVEERCAGHRDWLKETATKALGMTETQQEIRRLWEHLLATVRGIVADRTTSKRGASLYQPWTSSQITDMTAWISVPSVRYAALKMWGIIARADRALRLVYGSIRQVNDRPWSGEGN